MLKKRSVLLAGHATSVALEPEFWAVLDRIADQRGISKAALLADIDGFIDALKTELESAIKQDKRIRIR